MAFYARGAQGAELRVRHHQGARGDSRQPAVPVPRGRARRLRTASYGGAYRLGDYELASRLSFFLWGGGPDAELLKLAGQGRLSAPGVLAQQARRMLADPRADALSTRFASQWLRLQDLERVMPDPIVFPYSDQTLSVALKKETELFFDSLVREDRSLLDLLTADYTFVNERVARHYGIPNVTGTEFRRVTRAGLPPRHPRPRQRADADLDRRPHLAGDARQVGDGGAARHAAAAAAAQRAGARGDQGDQPTGRVLSVRERMEQHRSNPACTSCHRVIDPLGLALENFDVTGKWRIKDGDVPVDAAGTLYDGTSIDGPAGLRGAVLRHKDAFLAQLHRRA